MNKENFIKTINAYKEFLDTSDKLMELGIDLAEGPITYSIDTIFDSWLQSILNEEGQDLVYWWLFEDVDKVITDNGNEINVEDIEEFTKYLLNNGYFKSEENS